MILNGTKTAQHVSTQHTTNGLNVSKALQLPSARLTVETQMTTIKAVITNVNNVICTQAYAKINVKSTTKATSANAAQYSINFLLNPIQLACVHHCLDLTQYCMLRVLHMDVDCMQYLSGCRCTESTADNKGGGLYSRSVGGVLISLSLAVEPVGG